MRSEKGHATRVRASVRTSYELLLVHHRLDRHLLGRPNVGGRVLVNGAEHHRGRGRVFRGGHGPEVVAATKQCELVDHRADFGILDLVRGPALQVLFAKEGTVKIEEKLRDLTRSADVEEALAILRWGTGGGLCGGRRDRSGYSEKWREGGGGV